MQSEGEVNPLANNAPVMKSQGKWEIAPRVLYSRCCVKAIGQLRVQGKEAQMSIFQDTEWVSEPLWT